MSQNRPEARVQDGPYERRAEKRSRKQSLALRARYRPAGGCRRASVRQPRLPQPHPQRSRRPPAGRIGSHSARLEMRSVGSSSRRCFMARCALVRPAGEAHGSPRLTPTTHKEARQNSRKGFLRPMTTRALEARREQMRRRQSGLHAVELGVERAQPHGVRENARWRHPGSPFQVRRNPARKPGRGEIGRLSTSARSSKAMAAGDRHRLRWARRMPAAGERDRIVPGRGRRPGRAKRGALGDLACAIGHPAIDLAPEKIAPRRHRIGPTRNAGVAHECLVELARAARPRSNTLPGSQMEVRHAAQIVVIGVEGLSVGLRFARSISARSSCGAIRADDGLGDLILQLEKYRRARLSKRSAHRCAPVVASISCPVMRTLCAALAPRCLPAHSARRAPGRPVFNVDRAALVGEARIACDHEQPANARQGRDDVLHHAASVKYSCSMSPLRFRNGSAANRGPIGKGPAATLRWSCPVRRARC